MPAFIVIKLPQTPRQPGGGAAVALPSGKILQRFPATVDSPEAREQATALAAIRARALRSAWHASMIDQHEIDQRSREAEAAAEAEKAWSDEEEPALTAPEPDPIAERMERDGISELEAIRRQPPPVAAKLVPAAKAAKAQSALFDF